MWIAICFEKCNFKTCLAPFPAEGTNSKFDPIFGPHLGHAAQQGAFAAGGHRVHQNIFFVFDKIGVVRGAVRGPGLPVEVPVVVVHVAYPEDVFFNFNRLHLFTPECGVFPFTKSPALPHAAATRGESK